MHNIAAPGGPAYVSEVAPRAGVSRMPMSLLSSTTSGLSRPLLVAALLLAVLLAAALALWVHYGTAVFFEIVRTGWVSCF